MLTSDQMRAARALLRWDQAKLAELAGVSLQTIKRMEWSDGPVKANSRSVFAVQQVLETAGIEFLGGNAPGVRLHKIPSAKTSGSN